MTIDPDGGRCVSADIAAGISPAAALFHSLADETRLRIVQRLARGEARVVDLTTQLGLAQSTVSKHLACLRDCGLIDYRAEGRQSFYSLTRPELMDLLASAEQLLAATGHAVVLCPVHDTQPTAAAQGGLQAELDDDLKRLGEQKGQAAGEAVS
ncbi:metalloregulator ArsR/SmtB family transcription factor [Actinomadura sp. ATCC 31491]|uniref:Metalloregulator ArsR/SmtB family transcription factor n=1 Tax=Actinomadura luzonensis TaxID=2805427 RepID=A0ABT0G0V4_9ACTN|nr:metalloregulator ArsR/SmtB family transcription factor [Actinomadura luzonensis]MCK2218240.1 metalloregulator ArsR/SmtB family transcription factor [Actinomadura luzonensis]